MMEENVKPYYFLQFKSAGYRVSLSLNGFEVVNEKVGFEKGTNQTINRWLGQKNNQIKLVIDAPNYPLPKEGEEAPQYPSEQKIEIKLFQGQQTSKGTQVIDELWRYSLAEQDITPITTKVEQSFSIDKILSVLPITRLWQYAETLEALSQQDKYDIFLVLKNVRNHFSQKQYEQAYEFFKYRYEDEEIAEHIPAGRLKQSVLSMWNQYLPDPELVLNQYPAEDVDIQLLDNNRVAKIDVKNQKFPIVFTHQTKDMNFGFPLYLCKINKQWIIIR